MMPIPDTADQSRPVSRILFIRAEDRELNVP